VDKNFILVKSGCYTLAAAQSLGSQVLKDSQSHRCLMIATGNKQLQINK
jgi:hypothetical protein